MQGELIQLLYISEINRDIPTDIENLLKAARTNNKAKGITGALFLNGRYFIQVLEGQRNVVSDTFCNKICPDKRHKDVLIASTTTIEERLYPDWSMAFLGDTITNQKMILKYSTQDKFMPHTMSAASLLQLLKNLAVTN